MGEGGTLTKWDVRTRAVVASKRLGENFTATGMSVTPDGNLAAVCGTWPIRILNTETLSTVTEFGPINQPQFYAWIHPSGRYVLTHGPDRIPVLYSINDREIVRRFEFGDKPIRAVRMSADGKWVGVSVVNDGRLMLRSVQTERGEGKPDLDGLGYGDAIGIGRDGGSGVSGNGLVISFVYDAPDGPKTINYFAPKQEAVFALHYFEEDGWAVLGGENELRLVRRDGATFAFPMPDKEIAVQMAATDDGKSLFIGTALGRVFHVDLHGGPDPIRPTRLADVADRERIAAARPEPAAAPAAPRPPRAAPVAPTIVGQKPKWTGPAAIDLAFSESGKVLISGGDDRALRSWNVATGQLNKALPNHIARGAPFQSSEGQFALLGLSRDGAVALTSGYEEGEIKNRPDLMDDSVLRAVNLSTGRETAVGFLQEDVTFVALSPTGSRALSGSSDYTVHLWDVRGSRELGRFTGHTGLVRSGDFSPRSQRAVTAADDGTVRFWDLNTGREVGRLFGPGRLPRHVSYSDDGRSILLVDNEVSIWDAETRTLIHKIAPPADLVVINAACWAGPKGAVAVAANGGAMIIQPETGQILRRLGGADGHVTTVAASANGRYVAAAGSEMWVWELDTPATDAAPKKR